MIIRIAAILTLLLSSACTSLVRPNFTDEVVELRKGQYQLDKMHSYLNFKVDHLGLSKIVGRFNEFNATLDFDPNNPKAMKLNGVIAANSIDLNNADLESTLQEESWFNSEQYPQIVFDSKSVNMVRDNEFEIEGMLSMRGVKLPIIVATTFNGGADNLITRRYTIGFSATAQLKRSEFGMDTFSAFAGDNIEIELHGEFLRQ